MCCLGVGCAKIACRTTMVGTCTVFVLHYHDVKAVNHVRGS
jgi:hypothetical protein